MSRIAFFDLEINPSTQELQDMACVFEDGSNFHKRSPIEFRAFIDQADYICGHNILKHDLVFLQRYFGDSGWGTEKAIDTLLFSPLLFPKKPYHKLLKDDKLHTDDHNNPINDALKAKHLFNDEVRAFQTLDIEFKSILYFLLVDHHGFAAFFRYVNFSPSFTRDELRTTISKRFQGRICKDCELDDFIQSSTVALAFALALLNCDDRLSITPAWVLHQYPDVERLIFLMKSSPCVRGCDYCNLALNPMLALKKYFGFDHFRKYDNEPLQYNAVNAAIHGESLLAVLPTGGGKSLTFQVPALMAGDNTRALTVVISPLQSLMKDQVDNLAKKGITEAVSINGLLDPVERSQMLELVESGHASLLYIAPESLRSITIERLLLKRQIARFVIDEAHCFSAWGQDFRVDYLYIADFIRNLQEKKSPGCRIPVSCFTATAKQKVIEDICKYFNEKLNLDLRVFRANAARTNLHYAVYNKKDEDEKYNQLRSIIEKKDCPTIVYVSRTKRAYKLAQRLTEDGYAAKPFHGKLDKDEKSENQNAFMSGEVNIMVATSAFGMGVDKSDVGAVIHYDISDSLENYVQEAGRAGRDENLDADCYILFNEGDLDRHFILLNQTKISSKEINQVWKAIKELTRTREMASSSALEIARKAGWDEGIQQVETRVTTAIAALEDAGYLQRGQNMPSVFATSILSKNAQEAIDKINSSTKFSADQKEKAVRIIKKLFSSKSKRLSTEEIAESRVDYISDQLGIVKHEVIRIIELLREENILAHTRDLTAFIKSSDTVNRSLAIVENFRRHEDLLLEQLGQEESVYHLKELIEGFIESGAQDISLDKLKIILNLWSTKNWIRRSHLEHSRNHVKIGLLMEKEPFVEKQGRKHILARLITQYLHAKAIELSNEDVDKEEILVEFSIHELKEMIDKEQGMFSLKATLDDIEDTLFYLSRIEAIKIEGGFLVVYNRLTIERIEKNNRIKYKESDYGKLKEFYQQKIQQIHIVGEYAKKMINNYNEALQFVDDYFKLSYASFLERYFPGSRQDEIRRPLTPERFMKLFGSLSPTQLQIINDTAHQYIVVAAGPGSGKTRVLVHKLASLLIAEDVRHEQLLMLTFSRAAATEFKKRLIDLVGNAASFIDIKTFHSYCFDILGRMGSLSQSDEIVQTAVDRIKSGEIDKSKITKTVLVVDEAQDTSGVQFELIRALMEQNEEMRVIMVGDDDQTLYGFIGGNASYMQQLLSLPGSTKYELTENYRSKENIVSFANEWLSTIQNRLKTQPCFPKQEETGEIEIIGYKSQNLAVPVANHIGAAGSSGSVCVLTKTNEDAMLLAGLLTRMKIPARLIQSNDGFGLNDLYEVRCFTELINADPGSPIVTDEEWSSARKILNERIERSEHKEVVSSIIRSFEGVNTIRKYKSDWTAFVSESRIEDFIAGDSSIVYTSTIHKAKGKEFDQVYLMLRNFEHSTDEERRKFYVAITRAKSRLSIHYNGDWLRGFSVNGMSYEEDLESHPDAGEITLYMTHKHVQLWYFAKVQEQIGDLMSGDSLQLTEDGLCNKRGQLVCKYAKTFKEALLEQFRKGYRLIAARVNFIVYWRDAESGVESKIILPRLLLRRE